MRSLRVRPMADAPALECRLVDGTGEIGVVFLGRRAVPGVDLGTRIRIEGVVGEGRRGPAVLNPSYELLG